MNFHLAHISYFFLKRLRYESTFADSLILVPRDRCTEQEGRLLPAGRSGRDKQRRELHEVRRGLAQDVRRGVRTRRRQGSAGAGCSVGRGAGLGRQLHGRNKLDNVLVCGGAKARVVGRGCIGPG